MVNCEFYLDRDNIVTGLCFCFSRTKPGLQLELQIHRDLQRYRSQRGQVISGNISSNQIKSTKRKDVQHETKKIQRHKTLQGLFSLFTRRQVQ